MSDQDPPTRPPTLAALVGDGVLDARLAALCSLLLERGVPVLVAGPEAAPRVEVAEALAEALPESRRPGAGAAGDRLVRVAAPLTAATPPGIARAALAATTGRSGLLAIVEADDLAGVLDRLARQGLATDEISFLGVVLVLVADAGRRQRVVAAHYLRPIARDAGGHTRRLGPAVLAAWSDAAGGWEDFAWGIVPDLAERCRMRVGDFEAELARRAAALAGPPAPAGSSSAPAGSPPAPAGPAEGEPVG